MSTLIADPPPAPQYHRSCRPDHGFLLLDRAESADSFAGDLPPARHPMSERIGVQTVEVAGSHSVHASQPDAVADLIRQAAVGWPEAQ